MSKEKNNNTVALDELKQAADQQRAKKGYASRSESEQLTLFDIAPWPDSMRAIPNDYARSALFTVNSSTPAA